MLWVHHKLANHRLYYAYIPIERAANEAAEEGHPKVCGQANNEEGGNCAETAHNENWLTTDSIAQATPVHTREGLGHRKLQVHVSNGTYRTL